MAKNLVSVVQVNERMESIDLCSVHAPGIQAVADRIHEGCGVPRTGALSWTREAASKEPMIGGRKGVEDKGPMREASRSWNVLETGPRESKEKSERGEKKKKGKMQITTSTY
ncbi:hypothetical protein TSTA_026290 [Talaromyces stipitatus ATCC 10500]|uniref:Uncharacterized protein n=1 Tax=Talaromyces stipitatus (strain ATCC 10500 / CBS 375.48 / QM 6759 / NRRL 1006) TaxID=441959 RepID=B8M6E3_TALSN|nr:uncharacterized protein TSTA_026290 [Talaromyces stipitatus ATCC 10500]EED19318.1 hypothetical protein TSTA_026290 [Talaromyces stipitatus ATCC 10500]